MTLVSLKAPQLFHLRALPSLIGRKLFVEYSSNRTCEKWWHRVTNLAQTLGARANEEKAIWEAL